MKSPPVDLQKKRGGGTRDYHCKLLPHTLIPSTCRARGQTRLDVEKGTILLGPEHAQTHTHIYTYMCGREFLGLRLWLWMARTSSPTKKMLTPQAMCFQKTHHVNEKRWWWRTTPIHVPLPPQIPISPKRSSTVMGYWKHRRKKLHQFVLRKQRATTTTSGTHRSYVW